MEPIVWQLQEPPPDGLRLAKTTPYGWRWQLRRNGALTPRQFVLAFALACTALLAVAAWFAWLGAPLVLPFAALELLAVLLAFGWMARHASDREELELHPGVLRVVRWEGRRQTVLELPRLVVRVEPPDSPNGLVRLRTGRQVVGVGGHLQPQRRGQLARELRWALAQPMGAVAAGVRDSP